MHKLTIAIFTLFMSVLINPVYAGKPDITWQPKEITEITICGNTTSRSATFTSNINRTNVTLKAVPGLEDFVTVTPEFIPEINKGESVLIDVSFYVDCGTPPRVYKGALQMREDGKNKVIAQPLPIDIILGEIIDSFGGEVTFQNGEGAVTIYVPEDGVSSETIFTAVPLENIGSSPSWGTLILGYELGPNGTFDKPVIVEMSYNLDEILSLGFTEESLRIAFRDQDDILISLTDCDVDTNTQKVRCTTDHFTTFVLIGSADLTPPAAPTNVTVTNVSGEPSQVSINWVNPEASDVSYVNIYHSSESGITGNILTREIFQPPYVDTMNPGLNCYTARSVDEAGNESENSNQVCQNFTSGEYVMFVESDPDDPGIPDGRLVSSAGGTSPIDFELKTDYSVTSDITATVFLPENTPLEATLQVIFYAVVDESSICSGGRSIAPDTVTTVFVNGVRGIANYYSQTKLDSLALCADGSVNKLVIRLVHIPNFDLTPPEPGTPDIPPPGGGVTTQLDALFIDGGENAFPPDTVIVP